MFITAPLNFDYGKAETGSVTVFNGLGDEERVTVTEDSSNSATFTGRIKLQSAAAKAGDGSCNSRKAPRSRHPAASDTSVAMPR